MPLRGDSSTRLKKKISKTQKRRQELRTEFNNNEKFTSDNVVKFCDIEPSLNQKTLRALEDMNLSEMTDVQTAVIPRARNRENLSVTARTGSGKTLAYLIPVLEILNEVNFEYYFGTGVIILCPTRELCMQTYGVLKALLKYYSYRTEILIGGTGRLEQEQEFLFRGASIIVSTPRKLLYHLENTKGFDTKFLITLVLDEADRLMISSREDLLKINDILPKDHRQVVMVSATKDDTKCAWASRFLKEEYHFEYLDIHQDDPAATVESLTHSFLIYPMEKKFWFLRSFLLQKVEENVKVIVFFNTCAAVNYYERILRLFCITTECIHGYMRQSLRTKVYSKFCKLKTGILLCTNLAERGLDIPVVDWVVQFDPPRDFMEYLHRVGRTARAGASGNALLLLQQHEIGFVDHLIQNRIEISTAHFEWDLLENIQEKHERITRESKPARAIAVDAYYAHRNSYKKMKMRQYFDPSKLSPLKLAKSFGLYKVLAPNPPSKQRPQDEDGYTIQRKERRYMPYR